MKGYEIYLDKLVVDSIEAKSSLTDILFGIKELSGKLDTLIALKEVELGRQPQQKLQAEITPKELISEVVSKSLQNQCHHG